MTKLESRQGTPRRAVLGLLLLVNASPALPVDCNGEIRFRNSVRNETNFSCPAAWFNEDIFLTITDTFACRNECGVLGPNFSMTTGPASGKCYISVPSGAVCACIPLTGSIVYGATLPTASRSLSSRRSKLGVSSCPRPCETIANYTSTAECGCFIDCDTSPILISLVAGNAELTEAAGGVQFDIDADGALEAVSWTARPASTGWLALDRNGDGVISDGHELFGSATPQLPSEHRNGFRALALFDDAVNGGNGDGHITDVDDIFDDLVLWLDYSHDGLSSPAELMGLHAAGIDSIDLGYHESARTDRHGNQYRYFSRVLLEDGTESKAWDVYLVVVEEQ